MTDSFRIPGAGSLVLHCRLPPAPQASDFPGDNRGPYLFLRRSRPPATTDEPPVTTDEPPAARQSALSSQCMMPATLASVPFSRISFSPAYSSPPGCRAA